METSVKNSFQVRKYIASDKHPWNDFVRIARNGLFMFDRHYMDYHSDRFTDHSLVVFKRNKIVALFVACEEEKRIVAHQGLTFGGAILHPRMHMADVLEIFDGVIRYYALAGFKSLLYKAIPHVFHRAPSGEDLYAIIAQNGKLVRRDISSVIDLSGRYRVSETKKRAAARCRQMGLRVIENEDFTEYWALLAELLLSKYHTIPVHTLQEITALRNSFKTNIRLYEARLNKELLAGVVIYDFGKGVHTQYMATSNEGRKLNALDFTNIILVSEVYNHKQYYSFGTSTMPPGPLLNEGILQYKEMLGAKGVVHDHYEIDLSSSSI